MFEKYAAITPQKGLEKKLKGIAGGKAKYDAYISDMKKVLEESNRAKSIKELSSMAKLRGKTPVLNSVRAGLAKSKTGLGKILSYVARHKRGLGIGAAGLGAAGLGYQYLNDDVY